MGRPGKTWNVELTRKKVPSINTTDGSGAKPGIIGLTVEGAMVAESDLKKAGCSRVNSLTAGKRDTGA